MKITTSFKRTRWMSAGALLAFTVGAGGVMSASAAIESGERAVYVPITPCRVMDTRPDTNVGDRASSLGAGETYSIAVLGTNGNCTIPLDAVGLSMNVTAVGATADSFLTIFPSGAPRPTASNLNMTAGAAPTPNAVEADIGADGEVSFYNNGGSVDVVADIAGYYVDHNHDDRYYTIAEVDTLLASKPNVYWAKVNIDGSIARSSVAGITSVRTDVGKYRVQFPLNVRACAYAVTQGDASELIDPVPSLTGAVPRNANEQHVIVWTASANAALADRAFSLTVVC